MTTLRQGQEAPQDGRRGRETAPRPSDTTIAAPGLAEATRDARQANEHPLNTVVRRLESGTIPDDVMEAARADWLAGPKTAERLRESIFGLLGWPRGAAPISIEAVVDPQTSRSSLGIRRWTVIGFLDDGAVLKTAEGIWFGVGDEHPPEDDRPVVVFSVKPKEAQQLERDLADGKQPVWVRAAGSFLHLGSERDYRAFMAGASAT